MKSCCRNGVWYLSQRPTSIIDARKEFYQGAHWIKFNKPEPPPFFARISLSTSHGEHAWLSSIVSAPPSSIQTKKNLTPQWFFLTAWPGQFLYHTKGDIRRPTAVICLLSCFLIFLLIRCLTDCPVDQIVVRFGRRKKDGLEVMMDDSTWRSSEK